MMSTNGRPGNFRQYGKDSRLLSGNFIAPRLATQESPQLIWHVSVAIFLALSGIVFLLQQIDFGVAVMRGLIIPDGINITETLDNKWVSGDIFDVDGEFLSMAVLYGWTWLIHPSVCYLVNLALIVFSIKKFKQLAIYQLGAPAWSILGIVLNPYLVLATPGPNKEIPLLLLTIWLCSLLMNRKRGWLIGSTALCIPIYFLRDGYGAFLLVCTWLLWILGRKDRLFSMVSCAVLAIIPGLFGLLSATIPIMSRNARIYESTFGAQAATGAIAASLNLDPLSFFGGITLFAFRLLYNLLSLAIFPIVSTSVGGIYWIGISYWIAGLIILATISASAITQLAGVRKNKAIYLLSGLVVSTWFMVSASLFVQPRYLMPIFPIGFLVLSVVPKRLRNLCIVGTLLVSLSIVLLNTVLGQPPAPANMEEFTVPAYVW